MSASPLLRLAASVAVGLALWGTPRAEELNLFDWMGVAPVVVHGRVHGENGKYVEVQVDRVIRGDVQPDQRILVNLKKVNRAQDVGEPQLKLAPDRWFLLLLAPAPPKKRSPEFPVFEFVRGVEGAREVPAEGSGALLDAAETLAAVQDQKDERRTWSSMSAFLEDTNPVLIKTALDHHLKFDRGDAGTLPLLRPLLDHPRAELREGAALLIAEILSRRNDEDLEERSLLMGELAARARRDRVVAVRVAATIALDAMWDPSTRHLLEEIARDDPDQLVRYTAERLLFLRNEQRGSGEDSAVERR